MDTLILGLLLHSLYGSGFLLPVEPLRRHRDQQLQQAEGPARREHPIDREVEGMDRHALGRPEIVANEEVVGAEAPSQTDMLSHSITQVL